MKTLNAVVEALDQRFVSAQVPQHMVNDALVLGDDGLWCIMLACHPPLPTSRSRSAVGSNTHFVGVLVECVLKFGGKVTKLGS